LDIIISRYLGGRHLGAALRRQTAGHARLQQMAAGIAARRLHPPGCKRPIGGGGAARRGGGCRLDGL